jgi:hypothetical protein
MLVERQYNWASEARKLAALYSRIEANFPVTR